MVTGAVGIGENLLEVALCYRGFNVLRGFALKSRLGSGHLEKERVYEDKQASFFSAKGHHIHTEKGSSSYCGDLKGDEGVNHIRNTTYPRYTSHKPGITTVVSQMPAVCQKYRLLV